MQVPPTCSCSIRTVRRPALARAVESGTPACPAPMTMASYFSGGLIEPVGMGRLAGMGGTPAGPGRFRWLVADSYSQFRNRDAIDVAEAVADSGETLLHL